MAACDLMLIIGGFHSILNLIGRFVATLFVFFTQKQVEFNDAVTLLHLASSAPGIALRGAAPLDVEGWA